MPHISGKVLLAETAFQQAESSVFSGSFAENILFGKEMRMKQYSKAIAYSCLESDLNLMALGDMTIV